MPNKNFSDFAQRTTGLLDSDFIVGYDPAGPLEFRTTIGNLLSGGTASEKIQYTMAFTHGTSTSLLDNTSYYLGQGPVDLGLVTTAINTRSIFAAGTSTVFTTDRTNFNLSCNNFSGDTALGSIINFGLFLADFIFFDNYFYHTCIIFLVMFI